MTLRQALRSLSDQGLVVQQPGRGTFVSPPLAAYRLQALRSFADELRAQGCEVTTRVLPAQVRATCETDPRGAWRWPDEERG